MGLATTANRTILREESCYSDMIIIQSRLRKIRGRRKQKQEITRQGSAQRSMEVDLGRWGALMMFLHRRIRKYEACFLVLTES